VDIGVTITDVALPWIHYFGCSANKHSCRRSVHKYVIFLGIPGHRLLLTICSETLHRICRI